MKLLALLLSLAAPLASCAIVDSIVSGKPWSAKDSMFFPKAPTQSVWMSEEERYALASQDLTTLSDNDLIRQIGRWPGSRHGVAEEEFRRRPPTEQQRLDITGGKTRIGSSLRHALLSLGLPRDYSKTTTANGTTHYLHYGGFRTGKRSQMLVFENQRLVSITDG